MSVLANLLKKAETNQAKGDIPPGLLQTVRSSADTSSSLKKYLLLGGLAVASVAVGGLLALYLGQRPKQRPPVVQQSVPQPVVVVQKPVSAVAPQPNQQVAVVSQQPPAAVIKSPPKTTVHLKQRHAALASKHSAGSSSAAPPSVAEKKAVTKDRSVIDAYLFAARGAEGRRDYVLALKQYQKALEADSHNYRIMNNVASTLLQLGVNDEALTLANRALSVKPDYPSAMVNAGIALGRLGHDSAARGMFSKAVAQDPTNRSALFSLAVAQERAGLQDDATISYRRLADGGDARGQMGLGRLHERRGNKGEALGLYREVTSLPDVGQKLKDQARERISILEQ